MSNYGEESKISTYVPDGNPYFRVTTWTSLKAQRPPCVSWVEGGGVYKSTQSEYFRPESLHTARSLPYNHCLRVARTSRHRRYTRLMSTASICEFGRAASWQLGGKTWTAERQYEWELQWEGINTCHEARLTITHPRKQDSQGNKACNTRDECSSLRALLWKRWETPRDKRCWSESTPDRDSAIFERVFSLLKPSHDPSQLHPIN